MSTFPLPYNQTIHSLIAARASRCPDRVALITDELSLTYAELEARANRLAHFLRRQGVDLEQTVGVCLERSADLVVALLAVLKAGGTYLPLDPKYPRDRVAFMLEDAQSRWVITRRSLSPLFAEGHGQVAEKLFLEDLGPTLEVESSAPLEERSLPGALAYLIYTSGSTGRPKGVAITHRNAVAFFIWAEQLFPLVELEGVFAATSVCFDLSIFELFFPLEVGGTVILGRDALHLQNHPARDKVTLINTVPSAITELVRMNAVPPSVITVNLAGEPLKRALVDQVYAAARVRKVYNLYGPSEDTTYSTWVLVPPGSEEEPTIGIPIDGSEGYVVDRRGNLLPPGEVGELYLGGEGVSRCYLGRPDVTAEKYVPDPWSGRPGARLYRTGDRVRLRPDGEYDYLGRFDHQVKIRGFRIELGEIEAALARHPAVEMPLALVREDQPGDKRVIAYYQPRGLAPSPAALRDLLLEGLPVYMVPAAFVPLAKMPLTPNGKIDRNVLQRILPAAEHFPAAGAALVEPRTPLERHLVALFCEVLQLPEVSIDASFFELGGHSLLAARLAAQLGAEMGIDIGQRQIFDTPTVETLAAALEGRTGESPPKLPIPRVDRASELPISAAQRGLWFLDRVLPGLPRYNVPVGAWLQGKLNSTALIGALNHLIARHETLRSRIADAGGRPVLVIDPPWQVPAVEDLRGLARPEDQARRIAQEEACRSFALGDENLFRVRILRVADERHLFLLVLHHIVTDGISLEVLFRELGQLYAGGELAPEPFQMVDAVALAQHKVEAEREAELLAFWRQYLASNERADLPTDRPRRQQPRFLGRRHVHRLDAELSAGLQRLAQRHGATVFMVTAAALGVWAMRLTGRRDFVFGTPFAGRDRAELETVLGFLINTLPIRLQIQGNPTFEEVIATLRASVLEVFAHQDLAFDRLVDALNPERGLNRNPLYDVTFQVRDGYFNEGLLSGLVAEWMPIHNGTAKIDLDFALVREGETLRAEVDYDVDLWDEKTLEALLESWYQVLAEVVADPSRRVGAINLVPASQQAQIDTWNATHGDAPLDRSLAEIFADVVARHGDRPALSYGDDRLDYRELERRSRELAHRLLASGVAPGDFVAVALERSAELIVAFLAVVRVGAAYVPLDGSYPPDRLRFMLEDTGARVLVYDQQISLPLEAFRDRGGQVLALGRPTLPLPEPPPLPLLGAPELPAYIIYTSGSTGRPKGVTVCQRSIVRLVFAARYYTFSADDRVAQVSNASFDAATYEIWGAFLHGGHLVGVARETLLSAPALREFLARERITTLFLTSALFQQYAPREPGLFEGVDTLLVGGDRCDPAAMRTALQRGPQRLVNGYGPTETTTFASYYHVAEVPEGALSIPIGYPLGETELWVVDAWGGQAPIGGQGELWIGGAGLAQGYYRRPELTARVFVPHPWSSEPGARLYRTGDLVRRLPNGAIDCIGRIDQQVKVRGFRIELGEIEAQLSRHPEVIERVVVAASDGQGGKRLVAYVVARPGVRLAAAELQRFLGQSLPEYLVPNAYMQLDALPLNANGKVDRKALPAYQVGAGVESGGMGTELRQSDEPRTPFEAKVHELFCEVLGAEKLGIGQHFFSLGGHSLSGVLLISRLRALFRVELPLAAIYQNGTIAGLTAAVEEALLRSLTAPVAATAQVANKGIPPRPAGAKVLALPGQQALYTLSQFSQGVAYNLPMAIEIRGSLDTVALERALAQLVARHEAMRCHFAVIDEDITLVFPEADETTPFQLDVVDFRERPDREEATEELLAAEAAHELNLSQGPLLRIRLVRLEDERYVLSLVMHHSVTDGFSNGILLRELGQLYPALARGESLELPAVPQLGDVVYELNRRVDPAALDADREFWRQQLAGLTPLELPLDYPRPPLQSTRGQIHRVFMAAELVAAARAFGRATGHSLFNVLLAAFYGWLGRLCPRMGQDNSGHDVVVGTPFAGRESQELEAVVGFFVKMMPLRLRWSSGDDFSHLVAGAAETLESVQGHLRLPFDQIAAAAERQRDPSRHPVFQVLFQVAELDLEATLPGLSVAPRRSHSGTSKFDLTVAMAAAGDELEIEFEYCADLFAPATVARWAEAYLLFTEAALANPYLPVSRLPVLSAGDREALAQLNANAAAYPIERLTDAFWRQVVAQPTALALRAADAELSYGELGERVAQLAARLREAGVGPEKLVAICLERRAPLVVAMLAIQSAGGAYVPLDPHYPQERLAGTLEDCQAHLLLSQRSLEAILPSSRPRTWWLDENSPSSIPAGPLAGPIPVNPASPDNLAYLIYTSGSTGRPKGVAITHQNAVARMAWSAAAFTREDFAVTLAATSICFDLSIFEIFGPLSLGTTVVLADNALAIPQLAAREQLTLVNTVPSAIRELLRQGVLPSLQNLRVVNLAGEALPGELVDELYAAGVPEVRNLYGPSEDTTYSTWSVTHAGQTPAIGRPLANTQAYVLDHHLEPLPAGAIGEIYLGGVGISRGYLGRPSLTAERYLPDPWAKKPGARLYRTGDLGRLVDGELFYLGRVDRQVKIRGFRIEIGEVEAALARHPAIAERVVVARRDAQGPARSGETRSGETRLAAYFVAKGTPPESGELREFLGQTLPDFMVPSYFVALDALPRTPNGKIDVKALPDWQPPQKKTQAPPADALERLLAELWSQTLGVGDIGRDTNFFDLGGDSLHAARIQAAVTHQLGLELSPAVVFLHPRLGEFSRQVRAALESSEDGRELLRELAELDHMSEEDRHALLTG